MTDDLKKDLSLSERMDLWEMTRVLTKRTGLPMAIYASPKQGSHGPRIKVATVANSQFGKDDSISFDISDEPKIVAGKNQFSSKDTELVKKWIVLNKEPLLKHWFDQEYDFLDLALDLKKI